MKNKFIHVYDDVINRELQDYIEHMILYSEDLEWNYVNSLNKSWWDDVWFCSHFYSYAQDEVYNKDYFFLFIQILYRFAGFSNISVEEILEARAFKQPPSVNPGANMEWAHQDLNIPHWVCLYYVNDSDGDTILFEDDKKTVIQQVTPKKGRIVFFDGNIYHTSSKPKNNIRSVINIDFIWNHNI